MREFRTKFRLRRALTTTASIVGAAAIAIGIGLPAGAAVNAPANNTIVGSGSSTTYLMMQSLDQLFNNAQSCAMYVATGTQQLDYSCAASTGDPLSVQASPSTTPENPFGDVAMEEPPLGSSNGIKQLEDGNPSGSHTTSVNVANNLDFARSSRSLNTGSSGDFTGLNFVAYAADGISWFHFTSVGGAASPSANVTNLSSAQLKAIYNGQINNWDQVGGTNVPIVVFSAQEGSGTQSTFKTWLGNDPSLSGNQVNCTNPGTYSTTSQKVSGESGCVGPAIIFENEDASVNSNSFLSNQQSYLAANPKLWGTGGSTTTKTGSTTLTAKQPVGTAKLTVKSTTGIAVGSAVTVGMAANKNLSSANVKSISGKTLTLTHILKYKHPVGGVVKWATKVSAGGSPGPATNAQIQQDAIFYYSYGVYEHQCKESTATVNECGGSNQGKNVNALGNIDNDAPTEASILTETFPITRYLYNVYSNGSNPNNVPGASPATLSYVSEVGFICKPQNDTITDPTTGTTWTQAIQSAIESSGFYPLSQGMQSGTINQKPLTDEGSVSHPASVLLAGTPYAKYGNVSGTGLAGGLEKASNNDPTGFCLVTSTEDNGSGNPS